MKRIIFISLVAMSMASCSSCRKENQQVSKTPFRDTSLTIISPNGGESYHPGEWVLIKWQGKNLPPGTIITAGLDNINKNADVGRGMKPQHPTNPDGDGVASNIGEAMFQLPVDTCSMYHGTYFGKDHMSYGKSFKITLVAVFPAPPGTMILANNLYRSSHSKDFFTVSAP